MGIDFEATNSQYVSLAASTENAQNTFSFWVNPESYSGFPGIYSTRDGNYSIFIRINNTGTILFVHRQSDSTAKSLTTTGSLSTGTLYHVAFVADGSFLRAYINGSADASTLAYDGTVLGTSTVATIGRAVASTEYMDGVLFDLRRYNRALSADEIKILYNSQGADNITNGLLNRYMMNEGTNGSTATTILDLGTEQRNGTVNASPTYIASRLKIFK